MSRGMGKFGDTHYDVLEIHENADLREIREARNQLIREYHPDKIPEHLTRLRKDAQERAAAINEAYRILSDASKRRCYDDTLRRSRTTHESRKKAGNEEAKSKTDSSNYQSSSASTEYSSDYSSATTNSGSTSGASSDNTGLFLILGAIAYIGVVWGAWELMDHVARFSFVWWLCVLAILAGIPLYIAAAYVAFWLAVAVIVIAIVIKLVQYFLQNPY